MFFSIDFWNSNGNFSFIRKFGLPRHWKISVFSKLKHQRVQNDCVIGISQPDSAPTELDVRNSRFSVWRGLSEYDVTDDAKLIRPVYRNFFSLYRYFKNYTQQLQIRWFIILRPEELRWLRPSDNPLFATKHRAITEGFHYEIVLRKKSANKMYTPNHVWGR